MNTLTNVTVKELTSDDRRWFELSGFDAGTEQSFEKEIIGLNDDDVLFDCDGIGMNESDNRAIAAGRALAKAGKLNKK